MFSIDKKKPSFLRKATCLLAAVLMFATSAFATPTLLSTQVLVINNTNPAAGALAITFAACDAVNGNTFTFTGREILIANNTDSSTHTFTITPVADQWGGTNTSFTTYSLAVSGSTGSYSAVQMKYSFGWLAAGGVVNLTCSSNLIKFAVLQTN
jgi:hypothetical protein